MKKILLPFFLLAVNILSVSARVPCMINYQGKLLQNGVPISGNHNIIFRIYDAAAAGSLLWSGDVQTTHLTNGLFSSYIGETTSLGSPAVFSNVDWSGGDRYLEVQVDMDVMLPRERLTSVLYSLWARDVEDNSITTPKIADGQVTHDKIQAMGWSKVTNKPAIFSVPSGAVLMFVGTTTCPAGYTEVAAFRNRIPMGADLGGTDPDVPDNVNLTAGSKTHDHTISHTHGMRNHTHGGTTDPGGVDHSHSTGGAEPYSPETIRTGDAWVNFSVGPRLIMGYDAAGGGDNIGMQGYLHTHSTGGASAYSHTHPFGTGGPSNNTTDDASPGTTGTRTLLPPVLTVIFCQKN